LPAALGAAPPPQTLISKLPRFEKKGRVALDLLFSKDLV
jgi:hypothetical protein